MPSRSFVQFSIKNHAILFSYHKNKSYMKKFFFFENFATLDFLFCFSARVALFVSMGIANYRTQYPSTQRTILNVQSDGLQLRNLLPYFHNIKKLVLKFY